MKRRGYSSGKGRSELADYTFAVAKIRELENELLPKAVIEQMVTAKNEKEVLAALSSKGWEIADNHRNTDKLLTEESVNAWETLMSLAPDSVELKGLTVLNDFHNLKAALKSLVTGTEPERLYTVPTTLELDSLFENIREKRYYELPEYMQLPAEEGYKVLAETKDGQIFDSFMDREAMKALKNFGEESDSEMFKSYVDFLIAMTDIKIAYRGARAQKSEEFFLDSLCGSEYLDREVLAAEASKGEQSLLSFLETSPYKDAAESLKISVTRFERFIDDGLTDITESARTESFSVDPLIAYYHAKQTEIKVVRIIMTCKQNAVEQKIIRERLRKTYV